MKKYSWILSLLILSLSPSVFATGAIDIDPATIIPTETSSVLTPGEGFSSLDTLLGFARDTIFNLLMLITIAVFLFLGARLAIARGNPDEFKKSLFMFVYAVIGLFIISISYVAVKLVASLSL